MGRRSEPLRFVCRSCGKSGEVWNTSNKGIYCDKKCRADFERKGRDAPRRYKQKGYWMLRWNEGGKQCHQLEHRRIWEDANGPIPPGFDIHHLNHDRGDNRLENLSLMRHVDHVSHHRTKYHSREERLAAGREAAKRYRERKMAG
jgi:hypothetical protein